MNMTQFLSGHLYLTVLYVLCNISVIAAYIGIPVVINRIGTLFNAESSVRRLLNIIVKIINPFLFMSSVFRALAIVSVLYHPIPQLLLIWEFLRGGVAVFTIGKMYYSLYTLKK